MGQENGTGGSAPYRIWINDYGVVSTEYVSGWNEYNLVNSGSRHEDLFAEICNINNTNPVEVAKNSNSRRAVWVECRYWHWYLLRKFANYSMRDCAEVYKKDHATVIHGLEEMETRIRVDRAFSEKYKSVIAKI